MSEETARMYRARHEHENAAERLRELHERAKNSCPKELLDEIVKAERTCRYLQSIYSDALRKTLWPSTSPFL